MAGERTYPCLPCGDLDLAITSYQALGFARTYRQIAPNPYAVVQREDLQLHLFGMPDFKPEESYGSVIVAVPDVDALYQAFAAGLRAAYGKLPTTGFPRITRPRKRFGTVRGFSVIDVGGNWLRVSKLGDKEEDEKKKKVTGLAKRLDVAARLGDSHDDDALALKALEDGLKQYPNAPLPDYARALLYRTELALRLGKIDLAQSSFAAITGLDLPEAERAALEPEIAYVAELMKEQGAS